MFSKPSQNIFKTFSRFFQNLLKIFSKPSRDFFKTFSKYFQNLLEIFSKPSRDFFKTFSKFFQNLLKIFLKPNELSLSEHRDFKLIVFYASIWMYKTNINHYWTIHSPYKTTIVTPIGTKCRTLIQHYKVNLPQHNRSEDTGAPHETSCSVSNLAKASGNVVSTASKKTSSYQTRRHSTLGY